MYVHVCVSECVCVCVCVCVRACVCVCTIFCMYLLVCLCVYMHACLLLYVRMCICNSCNMGTRALPDMYALSPRACGPQAYISGKSRAPMLQVLWITSGTLKIAQTYSWLLCLFI